MLGRAALLLAVAALGAAAAALLTREGTPEPELVTAIGGNVAIPAVAAAKGDLTPWPAKRSGWTVVLVSVPKSQGKDEAVAVASAAISRSLPKVGILDSSRYPSAHPGFWLVFSGIYASEAEAAGSLRPARTLIKSARIQRIATQ